MTVILLHTVPALLCLKCHFGDPAAEYRRQALLQAGYCVRSEFEILLCTGTYEGVVICNKRRAAGVGSICMIFCSKRVYHTSRRAPMIMVDDDFRKSLSKEVCNKAPA